MLNGNGFSATLYRFKDAKYQYFLSVTVYWNSKINCVFRPLEGADEEGVWQPVSDITLMMSYRGHFLTTGVQSDFSRGRVLGVLTHLTSGRFWAAALGTWMV